MPANIQSLIIGKQRNIAGIIPDVTIRERHEDELTITDHPVGFGSPITDHAFKNPEVVTVEFGWSNSFSIMNALFTGSIFNGVSDLNGVYDRLLQIQKSAEPVSLGTGKRQYDSMLIKGLLVETDADTENVLMIKATFRHINIVSTGEIELQPEEQKAPAETASLSESGERALDTVKDQAAGAVNSITGGIQDKLSGVGGILEAGKDLMGSASGILDPMKDLAGSLPGQLGSITGGLPDIGSVSGLIKGKIGL